MKLTNFKDAIADISKEFGSRKPPAAVQECDATAPEKKKPGRKKKEPAVQVSDTTPAVRSTSPFEKQVLQMLLIKHLQVSGYEFPIGNFRYQGNTMDVFCISKGRVFEFAIITGAKECDAQLKQVYHLGRVMTSKHAQLRAGKGLPNFFWMVFYSDLTDLPKIPDQYGIIHAAITPGRVLPSFSIIRPAAMLQDSYIPPATYRSVAEHLERRNRALNEKYSHSSFKIFNPDRDA